jgi:ankyrin repeat protein
MSAVALLKWNVDIEIKDCAGMTPMHLAATSGNARITRQLLLKGAMPYTSDYRGRMPAHIAKD